MNKMVKNLVEHISIIATFSGLMISFVGIFLSDSIVYPCVLTGILSSIATAAMVIDLD